MDRIKELYAQLKEAETKHSEAAQLASAALLRKDKLERDLADTMAASGLLALEMADGRQVKIKTEYYARANQSDMNKIQEYLKRTGNEALVPIKLEHVKLTDAEYDQLPDHLKGKAKYVANTNQVKAFVRGLVKEDKLDAEVINLFHVTTENKLLIK